jgi:hypothetical protein
MLAEASGDVHRIAEIADLPLRVATLADDDRPRMNAGAEPPHDSEFARMARARSAIVSWAAKKQRNDRTFGSVSSLRGQVTITSSPT